jgi:hypothetical protein
MWFFKKKKQRDELDSGALRQLKKLNRKRIKNTITDINKIFKIYLQEKYKLKQSLTYEELIEKIKSKKIKKPLKQRIISLAAEINNIEYNFAKFDKKIFRLLSQKLKEIIENKGFGEFLQ